MTVWRKSSYSGGDEGNCVEVAALWRKSSRSGGHEGDCVEIRNLAGTIGIRDSKNPHAGHLTLAVEEFAALTTRLKR